MMLFPVLSPEVEHMLFCNTKRFYKYTTKRYSMLLNWGRRRYYYA